MAAAVDREAVGVGVAGGVEPIEGEALAEVRAGEQAVDESLGRARVAVSGEGLDLGGCGRKPGEVERQPADECTTVGLGRGTQALGREPGVDECIDGMGRGGLTRCGSREGGGDRRDE